MASGGSIDLKDPETQRWISAGDARATKEALAIGSLVPLPMAWVGKVLGSFFGKLGILMDIMVALGKWPTQLGVLAVKKHAREHLM